MIVPESLKSPIPVPSASAPPTADEGDIGISPDQQILASPPVESAEILASSPVESAESPTPAAW